MYFNCLGLHTSSNVPCHKPVGFCETKDTMKSNWKVSCLQFITWSGGRCIALGMPEFLLYKGKKIMHFDLVICVVKKYKFVLFFYVYGSMKAETWPRQRRFDDYGCFTTDNALLCLKSSSTINHPSQAEYKEKRLLCSRNEDQSCLAYFSKYLVRPEKYLKFGPDLSSSHCRQSLRLPSGLLFGSEVM